MNFIFANVTHYLIYETGHFYNTKVFILHSSHEAKVEKITREKKTMLALPDSGENTQCVVNIETISSEQRHSAVKGKTYIQLLKQERPTAPPLRWECGIEFETVIFMGQMGSSEILLEWLDINRLSKIPSLV